MLESSLTAPEFKVNAWGKTDLAKINSSFVYIPYEDGKAQRPIVVGPSNPNFVSLDQVSPYLKNAILTSEDNSFFQHEGFNIQAIRASIATNFKEKAFKRGGSTISMQLVKNVYLNREKTLARKVEEMLIVWLIEHNRIVSKERMFEVYLNIIEWGRNVYGVNEAAHYYFSKNPSELSLGESIFLASIIPRPKISLSRFDHAGHLKPYMSGYFRLIGNLMTQRGYAPADSTQSYGFYSVNLREALRPSAPKVDSTEMEDSTHFLEDEIEGVKRMLQNLFDKKSDKAE
jgi:membrane peptidoglycan carboxypeptidase